jgi:hypothetical protein
LVDGCIVGVGWVLLSSYSSHLMGRIENLRGCFKTYVLTLMINVSNIVLPHPHHSLARGENLILLLTVFGVFPLEKL